MTDFVRLAWLVSSVLLVAVPAARADEPKPERPLAWERLPSIPDEHGFAGMFAGVTDGQLLAAGGANFPEAPPWEDGTKVWYDTVWMLDSPEGTWRKAGTLPRPLGYGVSVTHRNAVICVGGSDSERHHAAVFRLEWQDGELHQTTLPSLPVPVANLCGAVLGDTLYVAGGIETPEATATLGTFLSLNLAADRPAWKQLDTWPGPPRMLATAAVQDDSFFLVGGTDLSAGPDGKPLRQYLTDAYRFTPGSGWKQIADLPRPAVAAPTPAAAFGQSHFVVISGDDGSRYGQPASEDHPGFPATVLAYHTVTDTWTTWGETPAPHVTAPTARWKDPAGEDAWVVVNGESRPGVRSPEVWSLRPVAGKASFGWINYASLALYPIVMLLVTWRVGKKQTSDEFFRAGKRIPWWAAGLSIYATMLSSITFMAVPATAFATDWSYFLVGVSIPLLAPVVIHLYLPFFRQLEVTSAYEYLERRFNVVTRWFGSASFIILQLGRTAIVLYLPALALSTVSNFDMRTSILIMGVICVLMTFEGGLESVVWTDVAQTVVLLVGALVTLVVAINSVPGGIPEIWQVARSDDKLFASLTWGPELTIATGWVILIGNLFITLSTYTTGQDVVQRYVSTKDMRETKRSIWLNALMTLPSTFIFFSVGTALYVFYKSHPASLDPTLRNDAIFPLFIVNELPIGLGGLVVAGIFAAAQPTSSLNSIATAWVTDFHGRLQPSLSDRGRLKIGKVVTVLSGVIGTGLALLMATFDVASAWEAFLGLVALTGSALAGLFALGIFSRRAHGLGAVLGAVASVSLLVYVQRYTGLHIFTYGAIGMLTCVGVGWLASVLIPLPTKNLDGLTLHTTRDRPTVQTAPLAEADASPV